MAACLALSLALSGCFTGVTLDLTNYDRPVLMNDKLLQLPGPVTYQVRNVSPVTCTISAFYSYIASEDGPDLETGFYEGDMGHVLMGIAASSPNRFIYNASAGVSGWTTILIAWLMERDTVRLTGMVADLERAQ